MYRVFVPLQKKQMQVLGVMSGSSLDGLDLALLSFVEEPFKWTLVKSSTFPLPIELRELLREGYLMTAEELIDLEYQFTAYLASSINSFIEDENITVRLIGVHGHTLWHKTQLSRSWQLLNGGQLAELCGCSVVCDFRNQDMALGGQGAPMAILADRDLFPGYDYYLNLGGIANLASHKSSYMAYDVWPCNQMLNSFANELGYPYDDKGKLAKTGAISADLYDFLKTDTYLNLAPPKSLDNKHSRQLLYDISQRFELSTVDKLRTTVELIAEEIAKLNYLSNTSMLVTGGGAYNDFLVERLKTLLEPKAVEVILPESTIIDNKEAILIAYAAYLRYLGKPNFISKATGASADVIGGALYSVKYV